MWWGDFCWRQPNASNLFRIPVNYEKIPSEKPIKCSQQPHLVSSSDGLRWFNYLILAVCWFAKKTFAKWTSPVDLHANKPSVSWVAVTLPDELHRDLCRTFQYFLIVMPIFSFSIKMSPSTSAAVQASELYIKIWPSNSSITNFRREPPVKRPELGSPESSVF